MLLMPVAVIGLIVLIMLMVNKETSTRKDVEKAIRSVKGIMIKIPLFIIVIGLLMYFTHNTLNAVMPEPVATVDTLKINNMFADLKPKITNMMLTFTFTFVLFVEAVCTVFLVTLHKKLDMFKNQNNTVEN